MTTGSQHRPSRATTGTGLPSSRKSHHRPNTSRPARPKPTTSTTASSHPRAARKLRVRDSEPGNYSTLNGSGPLPPFDAGTLGEILARPPQPASRVDHLIPWEAGTLIAAQRKTGKTTLTLNLAQSLMTGQDFLGRFGVRPVDGVVAMLNFEVSGAMLAGWADELRISHDRLYLVNLRGRRNPFADPEDRPGWPRCSGPRHRDPDR